MDRHEKAKSLVAQMSLAEKASLCSGKNFWYLKGIERLGLPEVMVTDGPHGLRKQLDSADHLGINESVPATCFPTASATACSFDRDLMRRVGVAIAEECRQEHVAVLLGPGINIKRSPLCGRNFEYVSEDPYVSGEMAAAFINGVQSQKVGVSLKHFAANNQEKRRMTVDSVVDERTLREIYLPAFERAVKQAQPWTVMCSYNRLNGEYASQHKTLLTTILRDEWGFEGAVVSDWGAVAERVKGIEAGMDIEMPFTSPINDQRIIAAVESSALSLAALDQAATRVTELILRAGEREDFTYDLEAHHALARRAAGQSAVLLKNEGGILPGKAGDRAAVIGAFARQPRYQGAGSSKIVPTRIDSAVDALRQQGLSFDYADGYPLETDQVDPALIDEACRVAKDKDIVYLFAGLPDRYEAEGFDRDSMAMPENHVRLIEAVARVNPRVVVVLHGGAPMEMTWADQVAGILMMYLGGQAAGSACADLLLGAVNPGGRLAESWPFSAADAPSAQWFPGNPQTVEYREALFVGYRYYDTAKKPVRFPFGYGLTYTTFEYGPVALSAERISDTQALQVTCSVKNTGALPGEEVVQLYVARPNSVIIRAEQELKGFEKVYLEPGESKTVSFTLTGRDFAYYNVAQSTWHVESGAFELRLGASSRDIRQACVVQVASTIDALLPDLRASLPCYDDLSGGMRVSDREFETLLGHPIPPAQRVKGAPHSINSSIADIQDRFVGRQLLKTMRKQMAGLAGASPDIQLMMEKMMMDIPLRFLAMMGGDQMNPTKIDGLVDLLNGKYLSGIRKMRQKSG